MGKVVEKFADVGYVRDEKSATNVQKAILCLCTLNAASADVFGQLLGKLIVLVS
jgi:hypothetical protein